MAPQKLSKLPLGGHGTSYSTLVQLQFQARPRKIATLAAPTSYLQDLGSSTLSFVGPTNLLKNIGKIQSGTLNFVGAIQRSIIKIQTGTLNLSGAVRKLTTRGLVTATLNLSGTVIKQSARTFSGGLSFVGAFSAIHLALVVLTATLNFVGAIQKRTNIPMTGGLSFVGAILKQAGKPLAGGLSFNGTTLRQTGRALLATLSSSGSLNRGTSRALSATLNLSGSFRRLIPQAFTAGLSFIGDLALNRRYHVGLVASMTARGVLKKIRWYRGAFKYQARAQLRAVSRAINNMLTKDRDED